MNTEKRRDAQSRTDQAYDAIKARLISLDLAPGAAFSEAQLATSLGYSKTPIREALGRLRREGLVQVMPRSGYRASPITLKTARDLFQLRLILEPEAAALAARNLSDPTHLLGIETLVTTSYDPADDATIHRFLEANRQFHVAIARVSGNDQLADVLQRVLEQQERMFHLELTITARADKAVHEHHDLLDAIVSGDDRRARRVAAQQIRAWQSHVLAVLSSRPAVMGANLAVVPRAG